MLRVMAIRLLMLREGVLRVNFSRLLMLRELMRFIHVRWGRLLLV